MKTGRVAGTLAAILGSAGAYAALAYATPRPYFGQLLALYLLAFAAYAWLLWRPLPLRYGLLLALICRLLWLPALPALSDDYHRFRWDGALVAAGQNPYLHQPQALISAEAAGNAVTPLPAAANMQLYIRLNSPQYYSVYPPLCQAVFGAASWLFPGSERGFVLVLRLVIILAEAATAGLLFALLRRFQQPPQQALLYLLNPLVIVELTGNLHFEALMICGLLAAIWALAQRRLGVAALALAGAVAAKLLPLLLLPLLVRRLAWARFLGYTAATGLGILLLFAPFLSLNLVRNLSTSLDLYFHKFEFNAGLYYVLRAVGYWQTGYNQIARLGTMLAVATGLVTLLLAFTEKRPTWPSLSQTLLFTFTAYFALATTVHPWYLTTLVALSVFSCYRYALVWSAVVPLSYAAYQTTAYTENLGLVGLEYGLVVGVLLWEIRTIVSGPERPHLA